MKAEEGKDPKVGTGKKPEGSSCRLYTDENPKDTVPWSLVLLLQLNEHWQNQHLKTKSQETIANYQFNTPKARAAYKNAKDPKVKVFLVRKHLNMLSKEKKHLSAKQRLKTNNLV